MQNHGDVKTYDEEPLEQDWRNEVKIFDAYVEFRDVCMDMLSDFETMWNVYLE